MPRKSTAEPQEKVPDRPYVNETNEILFGLVANAYSLRDDKLALYEEIQANRSSLRNLDKGKLLNDEQSVWLASFYPVRKMSQDGTEEVA